MSDDVYAMGKIDTSFCPTKMSSQKELIEQETITYQRQIKEAPGERVSLSQVCKEKDKKNGGGACFLCGRAGFTGDENTAVGRMYKMFRCEYSKHKSKELFENLEVFFREEIYNYNMGTGE